VRYSLAKQNFERKLNLRLVQLFPSFLWLHTHAKIFSLTLKTETMRDKIDETVLIHAVVLATAIQVLESKRSFTFAQCIPTLRWAWVLFRVRLDRG